MPLPFGQLLSSNRIHGKHYGFYFLMAVPTRRPLHQFFLESCKAHRILAEVFHPPSSKNTIYKVVALVRPSLLLGILYQFGACLHTLYAGSMPSVGSL